MTVVYLRQREGRHSRQPILIRSKRHLAASDLVMRKIGFVREGQQEPLLNERCCKCGDEVVSVRLPDEAWCRSCIKRVFGGER